MPETNTNTNNSNFELPNKKSTQNIEEPKLADLDFTNSNTSANTPVNQQANKNLAPQLINQLTPPIEKSDQSSVFGKSELLDANQILAQILGMKIGDRIADLGAGGGLFTLQSARLVGDQGEVYAVDIMKTALSDIESKARMSNLYNVKAVWSNIEILGATKIPEATLSHVLLVNTLFQSKKTDQMINEGARLLKSGGKMLIIDWSDTSTGLGPHSDQQINPQNIIEQAQNINLILEKEFVAGKYHFGLIFTKK